MCLQATLQYALMRQRSFEQTEHNLRRSPVPVDVQRTLSPSTKTLINCNCFEEPEALSDQSLRKSFEPEDARAAWQTELSWNGMYSLTEGGERYDADGAKDASGAFSPKASLSDA